MKTVLEMDDLAFPIKVEQASNKRFRVTYGKQVHSNLTYAEACFDFGKSVFHALACNGKLDNEGP